MLSISESFHNLTLTNNDFINWKDNHEEIKQKFFDLITEYKKINKQISNDNYSFTEENKYKNDINTQYEENKKQIEINKQKN